MTELGLLGFAQIGLVGFTEKQKEIEDVVCRKVQIDDSGTCAFPASTRRQPHFSQPMATDKQIATLWIGKELPSVAPGSLRR